LQRPIPAITTDHPYGYIRQIVIGGSIMDYRYKLYGDINISIQGNILREGYHGWNHIEAYNKLWRLYMGNEPGIEDENWVGRAVRVNRFTDGEELARMHNWYDLVVNTAPLDRLCMKLCTFRFKTVEITEGYSYPNQPPDTTIFNAGNEYPWVRSAYLFGNACTEWLPGTAPRGLNPITIRKPISHDCNCFPHVLGTGRFGAWKNEVWVDTAYYDVRDAIVSMSRQDTWDKVR